MRFKGNQWKGRLALLLALCMIVLLTGCGKKGEAEIQTAGAQTFGTEASGDRTLGAQPPETGAAGGQESGDQTPGTEAPGDRTSGTKPSGTGVSGGQESGGQTPEKETSGSQTQGIQVSGTGVSGSQTPGTEASGDRTSGGQTPETETAGKEDLRTPVPDVSVETNKAGLEASCEGYPTPEVDETEQAAVIDREGSYTTAEDVSLYLYTYGELPDNFITKKEANALGWSGGSLEPYAPGKCIGGDKFGNYEKLLPNGSYHECDIDTLGAKSRGAKRLVYSNDGRIYYTEDHYETFMLLYGEE